MKKDIMDFRCGCTSCKTERDGKPHTYIWNITESNFYHRIYPSVYTDEAEIRDLKKVYWVEIPKNASFTLFVNISDAIFPSKVLHHHLHLPTVSILSIPQYFKNAKYLIDNEDLKNYYEGFFIYRDPYERFRSMVSHYFIDGFRLSKGLEWFNKLGIQTDVTDKFGLVGVGDNIHDLISDDKQREEYLYLLVDRVLENIKKIDEISESHHWLSQRHFIPDEVFDTNYKVYSMTWVESHLRPLNLDDSMYGVKVRNYKTNISSSKKVFLSEDNRELIEQLYWDDFELGETVKNDIIDFPIPPNYELKRK